MKKTVNSAATKPSWMGDYSIGQVSSSLQTSSGQRSTVNPTLAAMFGGRSKQTIRGGGGDVKVKKEKHEKKIPGDHNSQGSDSAKKFSQQHAGNKLKRKNKRPKSLRPNEQSTGVLNALQKNQIGPARQSNSSQSHSFFRTKPSGHSVPLSKTKPNNHFKSSGKQLTPSSQKTTVQVDKIHSKTDQSKHTFFGDDSGDSFPRSKDQVHGKKKVLGSTKEQSNHTTNQLKNKNNFKTKKKRNRGKDKQGNINALAGGLKAGDVAKSSTEKESIVGKRAKMKKRKRSSETTSNHEVLHETNKKVSIENECSKEAAKKKKRRKQNKFPSAVLNKNNVESKKSTEDTEVVNRERVEHDSKIEGKETKKKYKRKWKIKPGQTSKDDESNKIKKKKVPTATLR